ncbi:MAG TPA: hypothetical protein EYG33_08080 [Candidatus Poseidoniales archaeon]|jgi:hypothetical protein|nr:hypothetical protein [Candidatus Poseidoniales archaeon]
MTEPQMDATRGATSLLEVSEKPIGLGLTIGIVAGAGNSVVLGIPLWQSILSGAVLGVLVCLFACPAMKSTLRARKLAYLNRKSTINNRARAASAFTTLE